MQPVTDLGLLEVAKEGIKAVQVCVRVTGETCVLIETGRSGQIEDVTLQRLAPSLV